MKGSVSHDVDGLRDGKFGRVIVELRSGSHLYGTSTPQSDEDIRGVFVPRADMILAGDFPKAVCTKSTGEKNKPDDRDETFHSLHHFMALALNGETNALDWLHAPVSMLTRFEPEWLDLLAMRQAFYCRNLRGLIGYARHQAAKYGIKGSRLEVAQSVLAILRNHDETAKMAEVWAGLPETDYSGFTVDSKGVKVYQVAGKMLQGTATVGHYIGTLATFCKKYGERAQEARENRGIDWKAISHAFRAAYQLRALFRDGTYTYPLPEASTLLEIKSGQWDYMSRAAPSLDALIDEVEALSRESSLPDEPDSDSVRAYLVRVCRAEIG